MRSMVFKIKARGSLQSSVVATMLQADGIRTSVVTHYDIPLATNPIPIVGGRAGHGEGEEWIAVKLDVEGNGKLALVSDVFERGAEFPSGLGIEASELEASFLESNSFEILVDIHNESGGWLRLI